MDQSMRATNHRTPNYLEGYLLKELCKFPKRKIATAWYNLLHQPVSWKQEKESLNVGQKTKVKDPYAAKCNSLLLEKLKSGVSQIQ